MNIFENDRDYFLKFKVKNKELADKFFWEVGLLTKSEVNTLITGVESISLGWVDWEQQVREILDFINNPDRPRP